MKTITLSDAYKMLAANKAVCNCGFDTIHSFKDGLLQIEETPWGGQEHALANSHGWFLGINPEGKLILVALDTGIFPNQQSLMEHIKGMASLGSLLHRRALQFAQMRALASI